jgi:hypothetical protein
MNIEATVVRKIVVNAFGKCMLGLSGVVIPFTLIATLFMWTMD